SLRGRSHPTVAAPRTWQELAATDLRHLDHTEVLERVARHGDPMAELGRGGRTAAVRDRLEVYRAKRDPGRTPEPVPEGPPPPVAEQVFVIQEHHARRLHYDLRLSHEG
ncbi:ATP-dependent DNA ligase, partial [Georgenia sp. 10Sc9-8]|nr:ATP-dependent DNA ligase [Georgenia halotolerans]